MHDITLVNATIHPPPPDGPTVPLGILYLTANLEKNGYNVGVQDYQLKDLNDALNINNFISLLRNSSNIIGISCMSSQLPLVLLAMEKVKSEKPEKIVILGGPGPTGVSEEIMRYFPSIDIIVKGEGEVTIVELLKRMEHEKKLDEVNGICFRDNKNIKTTPPRKRINDLDSNPFPSYNKINIREYDYIPIITARGCPYNCTFCDVGPLWQHKTYMRSISNVIEEIQLLYDDYKIKSIRFADDTFVLNKKRVIQLCDKIATEKLAVKWSCLGRINLMDEELMKKMSNNGCMRIFYGIESGSDNILRRVLKKFTVEYAKKVIEKSINYFDTVHCSFIWGFPFETMDEFHSTLDFINYVWKLGCSSDAYQFSPVPLSMIYAQYKDSLKFSSEMCPSVASNGLKNQMNGRYEVNKTMANLIRRHPTVFPIFYHIPLNNLQEKKSRMNQFRKELLKLYGIR